MALALLAIVAVPSGRAWAEAPASRATCGGEDLLAGKLPVEAQDVTGVPSLVTDGSVGPEGTVWDGPVAVILSNGGAALTYDLGGVRSIGALVLQADANDTYKVLGSADGTPGSYKLLALLANVVDRGPGLRTRAVRFPAADVRYLRVGPGDGDGAYSIAELAAYCRAPEPFPPTFPTVAAPLAAAPAPLPASGDKLGQSADEPGGGGGGNRFELLFVAAGLGLFALVRGSTRRRKALGGATSEPPSAGEAAAESAPDGNVLSAPVASPETARDAVQLAAAPARRSLSDHDRLRLMFLASGCAALIYEVVWFHLLRLVIGASAMSVGIVLASFMGGMFLGSLYFARFVPPDRHPLRVYAMLEIGIGIFGVLMPLILPAARFVYVGLFGYGAMGIALRGVVAIVLLLPPTALMGATLPAVARRYSHGRTGMSNLAGLYAANTAGAVLGCLLSAFYLLAVWDVWVATGTAAVLNFGIGWFALRSARSSPHRAAAAVARATSAGSGAGGDAAARPLAIESANPVVRAVYLASALSGMTALGAQVIWTRLLTLLFGATVYAFAIILAVFLAGLGIGSAWAARMLRRRLHPVRGLAFSQLGLLPCLLLAAALLAVVLPYASPPALTPLTALHGLHVLRAVSVILPSAILWGMSFPLALAAAGTGHSDTGKSSGYVYASNTVGAIVGALAVSFWAIPAFGTRWAQQALVVAAAVSAAALFRVIELAPVGSALSPSPRRSRLSPVWVLALGVVAAAFLPGLSKVFLAHGRYIWWVDARDRYPFVSEGAASTVAVHVAPDGYRNFHVSGRVEASNNPNDMRLQRLLGHLSALAHPHPESVLVVGMGAGVTAGALSIHPEVKRIVICEIEPRVVGAANQFGPENYEVLKNPKVEVVFDDARHFLATTREKFDVITSDPIHPWVRGNSILFSREYYAIVGVRLKPGGLVMQWVLFYETSELAIRIQMQTFMDAFPNKTI